MTDLGTRLAALSAEVAQLRERVRRLEQQNTRLSLLYIASQRLAAVDSIEDGRVSVREIVANLIGSEELALYECRPGGVFELVDSVGMDQRAQKTLVPGEGHLGAFLSRGAEFVDEHAPAADLNAFVPLRSGDRLLGALFIFRMLPHKTTMDPVDGELLHLLSQHAAFAVFPSARRVTS